MIVNIGDGDPRTQQAWPKIVDAINFYMHKNYPIWRRAMYKGLTAPNCLWFIQCSRKPKGAEDAFKSTLSAENWLSADGKKLFERAKIPKMAAALNQQNNLRRMTFANLLPDYGYAFIGEFHYAGVQNGYRVYDRIHSATNTVKW